MPDTSREVTVTLHGEGRGVEPPSRERKLRMIAVLAAEARHKFLLRTRSEANYIIAHRYIGDRMKEIGMRVSHIQEMLPVAVELAFSPTRFEVQAKDLANSDAFLRRLSDYNQLPSEPFSWIKSLFGVVSRRDPTYHKG